MTLFARQLILCCKNSMQSWAGGGSPVSVPDRTDQLQFSEYFYFVFLLKHCSFLCMIIVEFKAIMSDALQSASVVITLTANSIQSTGAPTRSGQTPSRTVTLQRGDGLVLERSTLKS